MAWKATMETYFFKYIMEEFCLRLASASLCDYSFKGSKPQPKSAAIDLSEPWKHRNVQNKG